MNSQRFLLLAFSVLLLAGCADRDDSAPAERATAVSMAWPEQRQLENVELSIGRLEAIAAPAVATETSGRVERILRDVGEAVTAGDVLAELDPSTQRLAVASAEASVRRLEALLENSQVQLERLQNLAQRQSVARDQLDEARTQVQVFQAQLEEARVRLDNAQLDLDRTRIVSPVSGTIQRRLVSAGDFLTTGRVLFELVASDALRAVLPLPEHLQDDLRIGMPVELSVPARAQERIEARVSEIRPAVGSASRALELIVSLDNPGHWRPGGSVTARVILEVRQGLVVPLASVVRRPAGSVVFLHGPDDRALERQVRVGLRIDQDVEILDGLSADEAVVVDGAGFLSDGARLEIIEWLDRSGGEAL